MHSRPELCSMSPCAPASRAVLLSLMLLAAWLHPAAAEPSEGAAEAAPMTKSLEAYDPLFDEHEEEPVVGFPDPIETVNRGTFRMNSEIDRWVVRPVVSVYRFVVPEFARQSVRNVLANLNAGPVLVNDLLQLEWTDAGNTTARVVINTTAGVGGLMDAASYFGLEGHRSDFGQTLSLAGVSSGPYLILPLIGPTTVRDGAGQVADAFMRPATYFLGPIELMYYGGTAGFTEMEEHHEEMEALRESSVDYYAAMRSAYFQNRQSEIWDRREHRR